MYFKYIEYCMDKSAVKKIYGIRKTCVRLMAHWGTFGESKISNIFSSHSLNDYKANENRWRIFMKRIKILIPIFLIAILFSSCFGSKKDSVR